MLSVLTQKEQISGPPAYLTTDWKEAEESVRHIKELNLGKKADIKVTLPDTLVWNSSRDKNSVNAVKITFKSEKPGVVTVDSKGHLTAKSAGKSTISVKVTLPDGTSKTYKVTITVKNAKKLSGKK
jgi:hypothetical protein